MSAENLPKLDETTYGELLDQLRHDLLLDAATDLIPGSVGLALIIDGLRTPSTSATAGGASALPANPAGYLYFKDRSNVVRKIPYYNA